MVIEPSLCRAGLQTDLRIFQQQDSQKIIETLLSKNQVPQSQFHLQTPYWTREYCVQYRETDLNFIQRWLPKKALIITLNIPMIAISFIFPTRQHFQRKKEI